MHKTSWFTAVTLAALSAFVACSSGSSNSGGGGGPPSCQNPTSTGAGNSACNSCLQSNCSSQLAQVSSSCQAYVSCYEACQCSDVSCLLGCQSKVDSTCNGPAQAQGTCTQQYCAQPCTENVTADAGAG